MCLWGLVFLTPQCMTLLVEWIEQRRKRKVTGLVVNRMVLSIYSKGQEKEKHLWKTKEAYDLGMGLEIVATPNGAALWPVGNTES